jgi:hypothetical protein
MSSLTVRHRVRSHRERRRVEGKVAHPGSGARDEDIGRDASSEYRTYFVNAGGRDHRHQGIAKSCFRNLCRSSYAIMASLLYRRVNAVTGYAVPVFSFFKAGKHLLERGLRRMTGCTGCEILRVVTLLVAPFHLWLGESGQVARSRRHRMCLMAVSAIWEATGLLLFLFVRQVPVRAGRFARWRHIFGSALDQLIERPVAIQANILAGAGLGGM